MCCCELGKRFFQLYDLLPRQRAARHRAMQEIRRHRGAKRQHVRVKGEMANLPRAVPLVARGDVDIVTDLVVVETPLRRVTPARL